MSILHSILKTIYLCGKQYILLRGHTEEKSNCIALINYRAETDQILATHLQNSPPNAGYLSPTMPNELIAICGRHLQQVIVSECNSANCFSVIADETTDVSTTEQIYLCVRYVGVDSDEEMCVNESFLGFAEANSTTGEELARGGSRGGGGAHPARAPPKLEKIMFFWRKIVIFHTKYPKFFAPPSVIVKTMIFWRKIVIFHTKYP